MKLLKEIEQSKLQFYIISDVEAIDNKTNFLSALRKIQFKECEESIKFSDVYQVETNKVRIPPSSYIGFLNNNLIINQFIWSSSVYRQLLTEAFPDKLITEVVSIRTEGNDTVTGGIIKSYKKGELVTHIRNYGQNDKHIELLENATSIIPQEFIEKQHSLTKDQYFNIIESYLTNILSSESIDDLELEKYDWVRFNDLTKEDKFSSSIKNHLPEINDEEISSAWVGHILRSIVSEEKKAVLFPNTKEIKDVLANIINELLDDSYKFLKSKWIFRKKSDKFEDEIMIGGSDRTGFNISFSKRFIELEKETNKLIKAVEGNVSKKTIQISFRLENHMYGPLTLGGSWHNFATQAYYFLKYGFDTCVPKLKTLEDIKTLNQFVNHSNHKENSFIGTSNYKVWKKPLIENCVLAILANDLQADEVLEEKFFSIIEDTKLANQYKMEIEKIRTQ